MRRLLLGLCTAATLACGGTPASPYGPTLAEVQEYLFLDRGCAACHAGPGTTPGLSLQPGASHASLVGAAPQSSRWAGTKWAGLKLVEPGAPERSLLMVVLEQPEGLPESLKMPGGGARVSAARLAGLRQWILDGARDD
jgi:hypothetical protein